MTNIYRITQRQAQYLMMAPAMAGGWCAVDLDARNAVGSIYVDTCADILALLPAGAFDDCKSRPVPAQDLCHILAALDWTARSPINSETGAECLEIANRVRAIMAEI